MNREKKQLVVLGVLAVMIVCVGAFQMMGGEAPAAPPVAAKAEKKTEETATSSTEEQSKVANPEVARPLGKRDPFAPSEFAISANQDPFTKPEPTVRRSTGTSTVPPVLDRGDSDTPPIWEPGGKQGDTGPLIPPPPKFGYVLSGFVHGKYPAAVFSDSTGNQKLVEVGGAIDASATLVAVYGSKVKVKFHEQTLFLTIGGNPNDK